jgi:hypothetical protein
MLFWRPPQAYESRSSKRVAKAVANGSAGLKYGARESTVAPVEEQPSRQTSVGMALRMQLMRWTRMTSWNRDNRNEIFGYATTPYRSTCLPFCIGLSFTYIDPNYRVSFLRKSLGLAKALHVAIIRQGTFVLDKNAIKPLRTFRFVAMREGPDLRIFSNPSTLSRLAIWLMDATRDKITKTAEAKKKVPVHPMVVACLNEEKGTYLIVGFTGAPEFGDVRKK